MAAEGGRKASGRRPGRRRRRRPVDSQTRRAWIAVGVILVLGVFGAIAFDDRHWHAFDDAGDVAYERGNFDYAERMYGEALQVAHELEDAELLAASLQALSRTYAAQGRHAEARAAVQEARGLRRR